MPRRSVSGESNRLLRRINCAKHWFCAALSMWGFRRRKLTTWFPGKPHQFVVGVTSTHSSSAGQPFQSPFRNDFPIYYSNICHVIFFKGMPWLNCWLPQVVSCDLNRFNNLNIVSRHSLETTSMLSSQLPDTARILLSTFNSPKPLEWRSSQLPTTATS